MQKVSLTTSEAQLPKLPYLLGGNAGERVEGFLPDGFVAPGQSETRKFPSLPGIGDVLPIQRFTTKISQLESLGGSTNVERPCSPFNSQHGTPEFCMIWFYGAVCMLYNFSSLSVCYNHMLYNLWLSGVNSEYWLLFFFFSFTVTCLEWNDGEDKQIDPPPIFFDSK